MNLIKLKKYFSKTLIIRFLLVLIGFILLLNLDNSSLSAKEIKIIGGLIFFISVILLFEEIKRLYSLNTIYEKSRKELTDGEKRIANYFRVNNIKYTPHPKIKGNYVINGIKKDYIEPDFYLPEYDIYVEFWGKYDKKNHNTPYMKQYADKKKYYKKEETKLINLYPFWELKFLEKQFNEEFRRVNKIL